MTATTEQKLLSVARAASSGAVGARESNLGDRSWLLGLATSIREEQDASPTVEGTLPRGLNGVLYRNGPGLFERAGRRKRNLLDGDGLIQAFSFQDGRVRYRSRFVRTEKFVAEEKAGRFLYPTWTTRAPGRGLANVGGRITSQAGVTPVVWQGRLLAFDDVGMPWALDSNTLETMGEYPLPGIDEGVDLKAHTKIDPTNGDWIVFGTTYGRQMHIRAFVYGADGRLKSRITAVSPRATYIHDLFVTERFIVLNLHAAHFSPWLFLAGLRSFAESLSWRPEGGNIVMVLDRNGAAEPRFFEAPAAWMWHTVNAYEEGDTIIADFVGFDEPDHFLGPDAELTAIMGKRRGRAESPGQVRRYVIDLTQGRLREQVVDTGSHEFPTINPHRATRCHRVGYFATGPRGTLFGDGIVGIDLESGQRDSFCFGDKVAVSEPTFVPDPAVSHDTPQSQERGWLLSECLDGRTGGTFLAVFRSDAVAHGPVARVLLDQHVPLSFHGFWQPAGSN